MKRTADEQRAFDVSAVLPARTSLDPFEASAGSVRPPAGFGGRDGSAFPTASGVRCPPTTQGLGQRCGASLLARHLAGART